MHSDPILREVHHMKDQCARQYDYDVSKIFAHLREEAEKYPERMADATPVAVSRAKRQTPTRNAVK